MRQRRKERSEGGFLRWQLGLTGPEAQVQAGIQVSGLHVYTWTAEAVVQGEAIAMAVASWPKRCRDKTSLVSILDSAPFTSSVWALLMSHCPSIVREWLHTHLPVQIHFCPTQGQKRLPSHFRGRSGFEGVRD